MVFPTTGPGPHARCPGCQQFTMRISEDLCETCRGGFADQPTMLLTAPASWQQMKKDVADGHLTDFFGFFNAEYGVAVPAGNHYDNMLFPWICFHEGCMIRYSPKLYIEAYTSGSLMPCGHSCDEVQEVIA